MNYKMIGKFISQLLFVEAIFMLPALLISAYDGDYKVTAAFITSMIIIASVAGLLFVWSRKAQRSFYAREGLVCVGLSWIVMSLLGCLPFYLAEEIPNYMDALFEIVSGFTTTGASIMPEVEVMSRGNLYWRSFSHWLGGMGVLVFLLALSSKGEKGKGFTMHILRAESPGPDVGKLVPKMRTTAVILYLIYLGLTITDFIFLLIGHMPVFDAVCTALGTAGTGGFGIKNDSMASYSPYIQNVCTVFMLLFGVNFSCYYMILLRQFKKALFDEELRMYVCIIFGSIFIITMNLKGFYGTLSETIRHAAFQVATIITTTGFATTDYELWPGLSKTILMTLMIFGACAGSTGGGLKIGRAQLLLKNLNRNIRRMLNPQKVEVVRNNGQMVSEQVLRNTDTYLAAYCAIAIISVLLVSVDGFSLTTNITSVLACFNNIGPGFDAVGPTCNYAGFSMFSKLVLIVDMLAGRLEIFPMLVLLSRSTWRKK